MVTPDEGVEEFGGDVPQEERAAHHPGRVVQLPLAQRPALDDLQGTLLLGRRRAVDGVGDGAHRAFWREKEQRWMEGLPQAPPAQSGCL